MIDYAEWAEGLLGAAAGGDPEAGSMYAIANWLAIGGNVSDLQKKQLDDYIAAKKEWFATFSE